MKTFLFKAVCISAAVLISLSGCNNASKKKMTTSDGKDAVVEVEVFDPVKMKDQIVESINKFPSYKELSDLLNEAGASYIYDLTLSTEQYPKMLTQNQLALGSGMYMFDWVYSLGYKRNDKGAEFGKILLDVREKAGLKEKLTFNDNFYGRIQNNADNKDSLDFLVTSAINKINQKLSEEENPLFYSLSVIGVNIEALHVSFQLAALASDNKKLLDIISNQKERVATLYSLLELMSGDQTIKPIYEDLKPIHQAIQENEFINADKLNELAPKIEALRNKLIL
ncbi:MAG: hypothetical protein KA807_07295 [Prolixibacteraceae bacterium]|nr:hypothetical protein [Prolixibacteraceae bacterium]